MEIKFVNSIKECTLYLQGPSMGYVPIECSFGEFSCTTFFTLSNGALYEGFDHHGVNSARPP